MRGKPTQGNAGPARAAGRGATGPVDAGALIDALPQIVWLCDADGSNEVANRRWAEYTGSDAGSPHAPGEFLHPDDRERTRQLWRRALERSEPFEADFRLRRHDGAWRWQLARAAPQRDAAGRVLRWIGTVTDIEAQFRAVHESAIDGFMVLRGVRDASGRLVDFVWVYANEAAERIVGRPRAWFIGRRLLEEMPGNREEGLFDAYARVVERGEPWSHELLYAHEGLELDLRLTVTRADDGVAISFADLSARRRAEQQLRRLQERQAFLLALGDRLRALVDPHEAMQAAAAMLGRHLRVARCGYAELEEDGEHLVIERGWSDGSMPDPSGRYRLGDLGRGLFDELRAGQTVRIVDTFEDPRVDRRGAVREAERGGLRSSIAAPLIKGGRLVALLYVHEARPRAWSDDEALLVREVAERTWSSSERARAGRALRQSEERLRLATEGAGLGTWEADVETHHARWSESQFRIFGIEPTPDRHVPPGAFISRVHPDDVPLVYAAAGQARATGELYRPEFRIRRADDGELRWVATFGRVIPAAGGAPRRFVGVSLDVTERKRLEAERESLLESERAARSAAEAATRAKDEFLATLSHELRTPLSVIISWSRLLQRRFDAADPELRKGLKVIMDNAFSQSQLITDLLDMSRIVSGKLTLDVRPVDLRQALADAVDAHAPAAEAAGIALRRTDATTAPAWVLAEAGRLHQVLGNLLSNALKFTPAGGAIEVGLAAGEGGFEVTIRDSGEGIRAEFLPHLFDRFRQAEGGASRRHGGLGLGLSVVRQLVEMHGGTVHAHSDGPGRGATFTVRLPACEAAPGETAAPGGAEIFEPGALTGLRVLAVEDEPSMRAYIARVLEEHGARVTAVESAAGALEALRAASGAGEPGTDGPSCGFDLLVSDIGLPVTDGYALIRRVRLTPGCGPQRLGALALTAFARDEDRRRCLEAGYQAHLAKPYQVAQLVTLLRQLAAARPGQGVGAAAAANRAAGPRPA